MFFDDTQRVNLINGGVILSMNTDKNENKDVFHAYLTKNAIYAGDEEIPCVKTSNLLPEKVISFSKALTSSDYDSWIHFYEYVVSSRGYGIIRKNTCRSLRSSEV